jgi:hypothetical protein
MKKKNKLLKKILWTTLFGAIEVGILLLSEWISANLDIFNNKILIIALGMIAFLVLSYIIESVEDKA